MCKNRLKMRISHFDEDEITTLGPIPKKLTLVCSIVLGILFLSLITFSFLLSSPIDKKDNILMFVLKTMNIL